MNNKTWIVVAHQGGARLVDEDEDDALRVFETLVGPAPERPTDSQRGPRASDSRDSARGHAATMFAHELAERLAQGRHANQYQELVLIAAPRFLGMLRQVLDGATGARVRGTLDKDYAGLNDRDLLQRLEKL